MRTWPGNPYPLGATYDGSGTNFSVFTEVAERVELCLFDDDGHESRVDLPEVTGFCWHGYLPDVGPGQRYGYRVHGPYEPEAGLRCNPAKVLIDPYAKAIEGSVQWDEAVFPYRFGDPDGARNDDDSAPFVPHSVVANPWFDWGQDRPPATPWERTVIYEAHVKGLTMRHPDIEPELRGTYLGVASPPVIDHLLDLGVSAIELMPVHEFVHDHALRDRGLRNYWGYNSIGFFAPHHEYAARPGQQVQEFKTMVRDLHAAGIEVILDVVYNHTAEGNHMGPMLVVPGVWTTRRTTTSSPDDAALLRGLHRDREQHEHAPPPRVAAHHGQPALLGGRDARGRLPLRPGVDPRARAARVGRLSAFFDLIQQDPVVSQVKLIAEPWDVGEGGLPGGQLPHAVDRVERASIAMWCATSGGATMATLAEFAFRFTGSSDLYESSGRRRPYGQRSTS
jgi:isoamylase